MEIIDLDNQLTVAFPKPRSGVSGLNFVDLAGDAQEAETPLVGKGREAGDA